MDRITIAGLKLGLRVGCTRKERARPQKIEMDVVMHLPLGPAGKRDHLRLTVDYAAAAALLKKTLVPRSFVLAETVAEQAAALVLNAFSRVRKVTVRVRKRALPGIQWAEVVIERNRG